MRLELQEADMILRRTMPELVTRPVFSKWKSPVEVADFSEEKRPAFRVGCHCRNCQWKGEARVKVGEKIPLWLRCPKCETMELAARGEFAGRDECSREEERAQFVEYLEEVRRAEAESRAALGGRS
jgi:hypothetical protein